MLATSSTVRSRVAGPAAVAAAVVAVAAVRLATSAGRRIFHVWPDEPAQLGIARFLGGAAAWNMHNHSTWRPGYGTLLAPVYWFTDDPETVFRSVLWLNAALGGVAVALLYVLTRRLTSLGPSGAAIVSALALAAPAIVFTAGYAWSESLVQALFIGVLVAMLRFHDRPSARTGSATGLLVGAGFLAHTRLLPVVVVFAAVVALAVYRRRLRWPAAVAIAVVTGGSLLAVAAYSRWIIDRLWNEPATQNKSVRDVLGQLALPGDVLTTLSGQIWYQLVATGGMAAIGAVVVVRAVLARHRADAGEHPTRIDAAIVIASIAALVGLGVLFISDGSRADHVVYGRYNDAIVAPLTVVGLAMFATARLTTVAGALAGAAAVTATLGGVLELLRAEQLGDLGVRAMTLGLQAFHGDATEIRVGTISLVALAIAAALCAAGALARTVRAPAIGLVAVAALVVVGLDRTADQIDRNRNAWAAVGSVAAVVDDEVPAGTTLSYLLPEGSNSTTRMMAIQFFLPQHRIDVVHDLAALDAPHVAPFVFAPDDHPELIARDAVTLWSDPRSSTALWSTADAATTEA